jgi:hypothetical protein
VHVVQPQLAASISRSVRRRHDHVDQESSTHVGAKPDLRRSGLRPQSVRDDRGLAARPPVRSTLGSGEVGHGQTTATAAHEAAERGGQPGQRRVAPGRAAACGRGDGRAECCRPATTSAAELFGALPACAGQHHPGPATSRWQARDAGG